MDIDKLYMPLKQINHSDNWRFARFWKRVNIGKENFDIVICLFLIWSSFHWISVEAFLACGDEITFVVK